MKCKNCHTDLINSSDYCNTCGAKVIRNRLTIRALFSHFSEEFLNYDNKFFQTIITLFKKPEDVITGYISGTRKKHVNVISFFAIAITFSGFQIYFLNKYLPQVSDLNPAETVEQIQIQLNNRVFGFIKEYQAVIMMLYIPIFALMAKLVFYKKKKFNYTELIVVFMYLQSQASIVSALVVIILIPLGLQVEMVGYIVLPLQIIYFTYCLKRLYCLSAKDMFLRFLIFILVFFVFAVIGIVIMTLVLYKIGVAQDLIEAQRAIKNTH